MIRQRPRPRRSGFTLVEVMVAAGVMVLGMVGMIHVITQGSQMLDLARKQTIAMQIIHGQIENIRLRTFEQVDALDKNITVWVRAADDASNKSEGFDFGTNITAVSTGFRCKREITTVRTDMLQVTFTVTWTGNTGRSYSRTGSTYLGKNGLYVTYQRS